MRTFSLSGWTVAHERSRSFIRRTVILCAIFSLIGIHPRETFGQAEQATITGTVTDESGAVVPGVKVTVREAATQTVSTTATNTHGYYTIPYLAPGTYSVTAELQGFSTSTVGNAITVEDERRTALMRTHSGLHVLCGVVFRDFGALVTGGNMEPLTARMDFNLPDVPPGFREAVEAACNTEVSADRRIDVRVLPRDEAFALPDIIRTATNLVPPEVKEVRIIDIVGLDQQADGGTHVASTRQVGRIEVVKIESKGKGFRRLRIRIAD